MGSSKNVFFLVTGPLRSLWPHDFLLSLFLVVVWIIREKNLTKAYFCLWKIKNTIYINFKKKLGLASKNCLCLPWTADEWSSFFTSLKKDNTIRIIYIEIAQIFLFVWPLKKGDMARPMNKKLFDTVLLREINLEGKREG